MHSFTSITALCSAAVMMATTASAASLESKAPSHLRFTRALIPVSPTSPGPGEVFKEGATCTTEWTPGQGNSWKSMTISLMTGSNEAMTVLESVATGIDGTSLSSYSWTCPEVTPNSAIYFYQFTDRNSANPTWTTRFTIAGADGSSTTPTESEQSNGATVLYGTGTLVSSSGSNSGTGSSSSGTSGSSSSSGTSASTPETTTTSSSDPTSTNSYTIADSSSSTSTAQDSSMTTSASSPASLSSSSSNTVQTITSSSSTTSGASSVHIIRVASLGMAFVAIAALTIL